MKIIGLTGSIGMGKSVAAAMLRRLGLPVFDSDREVHALLSPKGAAFEPVALTFPACWDRKRHLIDRRVLGQIVFSDPAARAHLEGILHPLVGQRRDRFITQARLKGVRMVALDIPLLFETGADRICDAVICVDAPPFVQKQRVLRRAGMDEARFYAILAQQMPQADKLRRADFVVRTGAGYAQSFGQLRQIVARIRDRT